MKLQALVVPFLASFLAGLAACSPIAADASEHATSPAASARHSQSPAAPARHPQSGLEIIPLTISSSGRTHRLRVEVARTEAEQQKGLMFRTAMRADEGMLFPNDPPMQRGFWMKNTVIPLDLLFIAPDRTIESIAANAVPYSLATIPSKGAVIAVLELNGGRAAQLGVKPGDKVQW